MAEWRGTLGAIVEPGGVRFRVWAPRPTDVALELRDGDGWGRTVALEREEHGYWSAWVPGAEDGQRYRFLADGVAYPDPCSRSQPEGVHGPSEVVDPGAHRWGDRGRQRPSLDSLVVYELHVGTFTREGTFGAAAARLSELRALGVTAVELMPVASFPGRWNWGYDGVALFAPAVIYGGPDGLRWFVEAAHREGLAVILDVVFNHFGPDGNYTGIFSAQYTTPRHQTPWGDAVNFDDEGSAEVRRFYRENLLHWMHEYHVDGFRFDATHAIRDESTRHILAELSDAVRAAAPGEPPYLFAESNENDVRYLLPTAEGGYGMDGVWADDFHHAVRTILTGEHEGYLRSYAGTADELARTIEQGFLYEGQEDPFFGGPRGTPARGQPWRQFVYCIQNHDQVGNRALGLRLDATAALGDRLAAATLLLLLPQTPLIFEGQEFGASTPFLFFTDHDAELGRLVTEGRRAEFAAFSAFRDPALREQIPDPQAESTFRRSQLRWEEAEHGAGALTRAYYEELLRLRREDAVLRGVRHGRGALRARAQGRAVLVELGDGPERRLLAANFGEEDETIAWEGPGRGGVVVCSDDARFGGTGRPGEVAPGKLVVPRRAGLLAAVRARA